MNEDRICCEFMRTQLLHECEQHPDLNDCPDILVVYDSRFDEYGMPIRDGGTSVISMYFCPWCGTKLPDSKRDKWFEKLSAIGITDTSDQKNIPDDFKTDVWWR